MPTLPLSSSASRSAKSILRADSASKNPCSTKPCSWGVSAARDAGQQLRARQLRHVQRQIDLRHERPACCRRRTCTSPRGSSTEPADARHAGCATRAFQQIELDAPARRIGGAAQHQAQRQRPRSARRDSASCCRLRPVTAMIAAEAHAPRPAGQIECGVDAGVRRREHERGSTSAILSSENCAARSDSRPSRAAGCDRRPWRSTAFARAAVAAVQIDHHAAAGGARRRWPRRAVGGGPTVPVMPGQRQRRQRRREAVLDAHDRVTAAGAAPHASAVRTSSSSAPKRGPLSAAAERERPETSCRRRRSLAARRQQPARWRRCPAPGRSRRRCTARVPLSTRTLGRDDTDDAEQ